MLSLLGMNGLVLMRAMDWRTFSSRSAKDSRAKCGFMPTSSCICCFTSSSEKVSIPQSVCCMSMISRVPSRRWEITRERISSSVITPPALRMMCASPSWSPSMTNGLRRASMHVTTATCFAGGIGRSPLSNVSAYFSLFLNNSSIAVMRVSSRKEVRLQMALRHQLGFRARVHVSHRTGDLKPDACSLPSCHVCFEGVGQLVDGGERGWVLLLHVFDELFFGVEEHFGVCAFLILKGRVFAAVVVVSGVEEQVVGEGAESVVEGVVLADGVAVGQIGAAAGTYEQRVGGQDAVWEQNGDEVFRVPRGVDEFHGEVAHFQPVAVFDPDVHAACRGIFVHDDPGRGLVLELPGARDVVGVRVGVHDVGRLQDVLEDEIQHGLDHLQFGVDDGCPARTGDDVAEAPAIDAELLEEVVFSLFHGCSSFSASEGLLSILQHRQGALRRHRGGILDHSTTPRLTVRCRPRRWLLS